MILAVLFYTLTYLYASFEVTDSDSGIFGPSYESILQEQRKIEEDYPKWVRVIEYGKTKMQRPLNLIIIRDPNGKRSEQSPAFFTSGCTHGNEFLGFEHRLPREFLRKKKTSPPLRKFFEKGGTLLIAPILNPDGYELRTRENSDGIDLNRNFSIEHLNFKKLDQPETKYLTKKIEDVVKEEKLALKLTLDYHCCSGGLLYPWSYKGAAPISAPMEKAHRKIGALMNQFIKVKVGTSPQVLHYGSVGTSKDYFYEKYGSLSFTYEGRAKEEVALFGKHIDFWEAVAKLY